MKYCFRQENCDLVLLDSLRGMYVCRKPLDNIQDKMHSKMHTSYHEYEFFENLIIINDKIDYICLLNGNFVRINYVDSQTSCMLHWDESRQRNLSNNKSKVAPT